MPSQKLHSPLFFFALGLKVLCAALFGSDFLTQLFFPFLTAFHNGYLNPYQWAMEAGIPNAFPYPALALYLMALPPKVFLFFQTLPSEAQWYTLLIYRLPLLLADYGLFRLLAKFFPDKPKGIINYYWLSPILFYITYFHGQIDVLAIALLWFSIYLLFKGKNLWAAIAFGAALSCKTHIIATLPFILLYQYRNTYQRKESLKFLGIVTLAFVLINSPYLANLHFLKMVFSNAEQGKLFFLSYLFPNGVALFFLPLAYLLLLYQFSQYKFPNRDILVMYLGFTFGIFLLLIPPQPGWYYWLIPFFIYFFLRFGQTEAFLFHGLSLLFILYQIFTPEGDFYHAFKTNFPQLAVAPSPYQWVLNQFGWMGLGIQSLIFTLLQAILFLNIAYLYRRGIHQYRQQKIWARPYLIAISGDSASGKSTLAENLQNLLGEHNVTSIQGDDMHRWERGHPAYQNITHLNPAANNLHTELQHAIALSQGLKIWRRQYDHSNGTFTLPFLQRPKRITIFQGLHPLYLPRMRQLMDLKIFLKPEEDLRIRWKQERDQQKRGYTTEEVAYQIEQRQADADKFILAQEQFADVVINFQLNAEGVITQLNFYFQTSIDLDSLLLSLTNCPSLQVIHQYNNFSLNDRQEVQLLGNISAAEIGGLAQILVPELKELQARQLTWQADFNGLIQLVCCYLIFQKNKP